MVARPRPWVWRTALVLNALIVATWAVSRTVGLPFGPEALRTEDPSAPDIVCSVLEAGIVVLSGIALAIPERLAHPVRDRWSARFSVAALSVGAVVVAAVMLTPSYVDAHESGTGHTHSGTAADGHDHGTTVALDGTTPCELSGPPASSGQVATTPRATATAGPLLQQPITEAERDRAEHSRTRHARRRRSYPTVADAEAAGYRMSVSFVPCIGAHYTNSLLTRSFDPAQPSELLFDGTNPDSKIIGLSYLVVQRRGRPDGFAGPNDCGTSTTSTAASA